MVFSADLELKRTLQLLKEVRYLYGQFLTFFLPVPAPSAKLAKVLLRLKDGVNRFVNKYNTGEDSRVVFFQLTLGLCDTLATLKSGLTSCSRWHGSDKLDEADLPVAWETAWIEHILDVLSHISTTVELMNEAMEWIRIESFTIRTVETIKDSQRRTRETDQITSQLHTLMKSFLYGITNKPNGSKPEAFTFGNYSNREIGQRIEAKLERKVQEAVGAKSGGEDLLAWKTRHSIYWLSKSTERLEEWRQEHGVALSYHSLPASDIAWEHMGRIFANALKAAWLLNNLGCLRGYNSPSHEMIEVINCVKRETLRLLKSFYDDIFTVPDYELIDSLGDFDVRMAEEQKENTGWQHKGTPSLSRVSSEPESIHEQVSSTICSSPVELEAASPVLSQPQSIASPSSGTAQSPAVSSAPGVRPFRTNPSEGLHIVGVEFPTAPAETSSTTSDSQEIELPNTETLRIGFTHNIVTIDTSNALQPIPSRVRIFASTNSPYLTLYTYRPLLPEDKRIIQTSTDSIIPVYAFSNDRADTSELYIITGSGQQTSLRYRFHCRQDTGEYYPSELYGFQGALMRAYFEGDYCAAGVELHRKGDSRTRVERFPRMQVWTDFPSSWALRGLHGSGSGSGSDDSMSTTSPSLTNSSPVASDSISGKEFSVLTTRLERDVNHSKLFIFSQNFVYVVFISDRISLLRPAKGGLLHSKPQVRTRVRLVPSKRSGSSAIRVRTLRGTRDTPAGIPLDGGGLGHAEQEGGDGFEDFQSIEVEFDSEEDASKFVNDFNKYVVQWQQRCGTTETFRALQRERRISTSSKMTFGKRRHTAPTEGGKEVWG